MSAGWLPAEEADFVVTVIGIADGRPTVVVAVNDAARGRGLRGRLGKRSY